MKLCQEKGRERFLSQPDIDRVCDALDRLPGQVGAGALRLMLLSGAWKMEACKARWREFALDAGMWTKPSANMKGEERSPIPLSDAAIALLSSLRDGAVQRAATSPGGQDQYSAGYLPYTIIDGFQQVRKDFGIWRALSVGLATATADADRAYFCTQLQLRQRLIIRDIGTWSRFVADASQPMHVSVHFNGWGNYPNPNGYTTAPIRGPFEGTFVHSLIDFGVVYGQVRPYIDRGGAPIEQRVPLYLAETLGQMAPAYAAAQASGNDNYQTAQPVEVAIVTKQLAAGVAELRDEIVDAWRQSEQIAVGFPLVRVTDIESHAVPMTTTTLASD